MSDRWRRGGAFRVREHMVRRPTHESENDMAITTEPGIRGFIVGNMRLEQTKNNVLRFTARVGQDHFERLGPGEFRQLESDYFNIVQLGDHAQKSFAHFKPGDRFIANGEIRPFTYTNRNGEEISGEEFRVTSIGHDPARTNYEVDRTPRNPPRGVDQEAPSQNLEHGDGLSEAPDSPEQSTEPESPTPTTEAMDGATPEEPEPAPAPALPEPAAAAVEADAATEGRGRRLAQIFGGGVSNRPTPVAATHDLSR